MVKPIEVQSILTGSMAAKPSPVEHVASPTNSTHSTASSGRTSFQSHGRAMSVVPDTTAMGTVRTNRFSTSFPVQPATAMSPTRISQSPTRDAPPVVPEALASPTGPTDTTFLTAIATQERRVLELKEELQRAEADLNKLKRQWAQHEANKKKNDVRKVTKLQPVQTSLPAADKEEDADGSNAWMQQEMERRKALMSGGRSSNRTLFSGSRHTRTLSLLSPARDDGRPPAKQPLPARKESLSGSSKHSTDPERSVARPQLIARASTTPDLTTEVADTVDQDIDLPNNMDKAALDHEILIKAGKKMANDFKDGLWTFFEDLRQATVGDEAAPGHQRVLPQKEAGVRRHNSPQAVRSSRSALRPSDGSRSTKTPSPARKSQHVKSATQGALPDLANPSFWSENGMPSQQQATALTPVKKSPSMRGHAKTPSKAVSIASTDAWDAWDDSPQDSRSSSTTSESNTAATTVSGPGSPRPNETRSSLEGQRAGTAKKDPLPWPQLSKLGPATLRRTASHLMSEWEKSLTPSPGQEFSGQEDYLGLGAEAAAMHGGGGKKD